MVVLGLVAAIAILLTPLPSRWTDAWRYKLLDLGHIPLFACLLFWLGWVLGKRWKLASCILIALAAAGELIQDRFGRSGNLPDFLRSLIGLALGLVIVHFAGGARTAQRFGRAALWVMVLLAWPAWEGGPVIANAIDSWARFPVLADFWRNWRMGDWEAYNARLTRVPNPLQPGAWAARIDFFAPAEYTGVLFRPVICDWRGYTELCLEVVCDGPPVRMTMVAKDFRREMDYFDRFNFTSVYETGRNLRRIPLSAIHSGPKNPPLNLAEVQSLNFYCSNTKAAAALSIARLWLE